MESKKRVANKPYNPEHPPQFLGIFPNDSQQLASKVTDKCKYAFQQFCEKYPDDQVLIDDFTNFDKTFKNPQSHHITSYFCGGKADNTQFYTNFEEGISIPIVATCIAYVPQRIICAACQVDQNIIDIFNRVPHLTMKIGLWPAKMSNQVLETLFVEKGAPLKQLFDNGSIHQITGEEPIVEKYSQLQIGQEGKFDIYFIQLQNQISVQGTTRSHGASGGGNAGKGKNKK